MGTSRTKWSYKNGNIIYKLGGFPACAAFDFFGNIMVISWDLLSKYGKINGDIMECICMKYCDVTGMMGVVRRIIPKWPQVLCIFGFVNYSNSDRLGVKNPRVYW